MSQYLRIYELKDRAKDYLHGYYGVMILALVLFGMAQLVFQLVLSAPVDIVSRSQGNNSVGLLMATHLVNFILQLFQGFMMLGFALMCLKIRFSHYVSFTDIFSGFSQRYFTKTLAVTGFRVILAMICMAPANYIFDHMAGFKDSKQLLIYLGALLIGYVVYIPLTLPLELCYYLILDFDTATVPEIIKNGYLITKGQIKRFFGMQCSFIPLLLLGILTVGIGYLWIIPYMHMTTTLFYLDIMQKKK